MPDEVVVEPAVEQIVEEPVVEPEPPVDAFDVIVVGAMNGGKLVTNRDGQLLWVSPNGTRTVIAGA